MKRAMQGKSKKKAAYKKRGWLHPLKQGRRVVRIEHMQHRERKRDGLPYVVFVLVCRGSKYREVYFRDCAEDTTKFLEFCRAAQLSHDEISAISFSKPESFTPFLKPKRRLHFLYFGDTPDRMTFEPYLPPKSHAEPAAKQSPSRIASVESKRRHDGLSYIEITLDTGIDFKERMVFYDNLRGRKGLYAVARKAGMTEQEWWQVDFSDASTLSALQGSSLAPKY